MVHSLKTNPSTLSFLHLRDTDTAGHEYGWMSPGYKKAAQRMDGYLGRILNTVERNDYLRKHLAVIITADHGGLPGTRGHGDATKAADYTIPFIVFGPNIPHGANLYELNKISRQKPGTDRTKSIYSGKAAIHNGDVANLVLDFVDEPSVPGSIFNYDQTLNVFPPVR